MLRFQRCKDLPRRKETTVKPDDKIDAQSLRGFLQMVTEQHPEELLRIRQPVKTHLDITSLVFELERAGRSPVVIFENVEGHTMPVVTNIAGNRKLLAACLGVAAGRSCRPPSASAARNTCPARSSHARLGTRWASKATRSTSPSCRSRCISRVDAAPYITAGQITARDPVTGVDTTGFHRLMLKGKNRLGVSLHSRRRMYEFHRRAEEKGQGAARRHHDRHPSAALHGLDGLRLSAERAEIRDHRRSVRRAISRGATAGSASSRCRPAPRSSSRARSCADVQGAGGPVQRIHRIRVLPQHAECASSPIACACAGTRCTTASSSGMSQDHILVSCITREGEILNTLRRNLPNVRRCTCRTPPAAPSWPSSR